ncbi:hypothetical protein [Sulfuricaulis sp.]|jgi:hypothetical protein|uniref:hypothetical protein n=1 Tax=Sulfuricaulis sp. TaxID=2003553 RepID=UPI003559F6AF
MPEVSHHDTTARESGLRLRAAIRALLSPGIWLVLAVQIALVFSMRDMPADASTMASVLAIFLTATALTLFYYLQAGAFHALTLGRETLAVMETVRAGRAVFAAFVWLTVKAGLLLAAVMNVFIFAALLLTGQDIKAIMNALSPFFSLVVGILTFVFVYWLPIVFVRREFHLLPSLKSALQNAWDRRSDSAFLAFLVLVPVLVSGFLPSDTPLLFDLLVSVVSGVMGWIAYIYCIEVLREQPPQAGSANSPDL